MAYFQGQKEQTVKPISQRATMVRAKAPQRVVKMAQKQGRKPINRRGYPTLGVPLPLNMSMQPGQSFLGASLNVLPEGFTSFGGNFTSASSTIPADQPSGGGIFDSITSGLSSLVNMWNNRPEELKKIRLRVNPQQVMQTVQQAVPAGTVSKTVDQLRSWGVDPRLLVPGGSVPITGTTAGAAYRAAGFDWSTYLPWIVGGGVALVALPMLMRK